MNVPYGRLVAQYSSVTVAREVLHAKFWRKPENIQLLLARITIGGPGKMLIRGVSYAVWIVTGRSRVFSWSYVRVTPFGYLAPPKVREGLTRLAAEGAGGR